MLLEREFTQAIDLSESQYVEDGGVPCLRNCKILGDSSQNDRIYTLEAMSRACPLYENANVNLNHPSDPHKSRDFQDRFGWITKARMQEGRDGKSAPYGDLCFNPEHPWAKTAMWWAKNHPTSLGLSHNAVGKGRDENGKFIVEEIAKVRSVDLVADPATTKSLYESHDMSDANKPIFADPFLKSLVESKDELAAKALVESHVKMTMESDLIYQIGQHVGQIIRDDKTSMQDKAIKLLTATKLLPEGKKWKLVEDENEVAALTDEERKKKEEEEKKKEEEEKAKKEEEEKAKKEAEAAEAVKHKAETDLVELAESIQKSVAARAEKFTLALDSAKAKSEYEKGLAQAKKLCLEAKMPERLVTKLFLEECAEAKDETKIKRMIEDRLVLLDVRRPEAPGRPEGASKKEATDVKCFVEAISQ